MDSYAPLFRAITFQERGWNFVRVNLLSEEHSDVGSFNRNFNHQLCTWCLTQAPKAVWDGCKD